MKINIFYLKRQLVHKTTFTTRSKHEKYTKHINMMFETSQAIQIYVHMTG